MRELKFRVWFGDEMTVIDWANAPGIIASRLWVAVLSDAIQRKDVVMQFTGLKDKNGKEIYEKDSVEFRNKTWTVEWEGASFSLIRDDHPGYLLETHLLTQIEVVGNVYQPSHIDRVAQVFKSTVEKHDLSDCVKQEVEK